MNTIKFSTALILSFFTYISASSQVTLSSKDGYDVIITIVPKSVYVYGSSCQWGYNYDINFDYKVEFVGTNKPKSLYTLQGYVNTPDANLFFDLPNKESNGSERTRGRAWTNRNDCASVSIESTVISIIILEVEGPGIPHQSIAYKNNSSLPIELISFSANRKADLINFNWATATETNNDFFTIEGSVDGKDFKSLSVIKGAGNSNGIVSYNQTINDSKITYARLKQTDFDGKYSYSDLIHIASSTNKINYSVYPNPNQSNEIVFQGENPEILNLSIYSIAGNLISSFDLTSSKISLPNLTPGMYFLTFTNKLSNEVEKIKYIQK